MADRSYYFRDPSDPIVQAYKKYMRTIVKLFDATDAEADAFVSSTFNFEKKLANVSHECMVRNFLEFGANTCLFAATQPPQFQPF